MPNVSNISESAICDLADIVTGKKVLSTLSDVEKYQYLRKYFCPTDKSLLFQKRVHKGGETKTLIYQLLWIQKKDWHVYSKELQGGLFKYCVLFDDDDTQQRGKFVKTVSQDIGKSEKIKEHQLTEYHKRNAEKAKHFITVFEDPAKAVSYDKNENEKYECNLYILKVLIQAVLLCSEQGLPLRGHRDYGEFDVTREKGTDE